MMSTYKEKSAFLIPSYNDNEELKKTLFSLDGEGIDILVVDDGSEVPVSSALETSDFNFNFDIMRLHKNQGIIYALNTGIELLRAKGYQYIFRMDAGDINIPGRVDKQLELMNKKNLVLVGGHVEYFSHKEHFVHKVPLDARTITNQQCFRSCFIHPSVLMDIRYIPTADVYSSFYVHAEDYELFLRLSKKFASRIGNVDQPVVKCLIRSSGISLSNRTQQIKSVIKAQCNHFEYSNFYSYLGLLKSVFLLCIPYEIVQKIKLIIR